MWRRTIAWGEGPTQQVERAGRLVHLDRQSRQVYQWPYSQLTSGTYKIHIHDDDSACDGSLNWGHAMAVTFCDS